MAATRPAELETALDHLRDLPFVDAVDLRPDARQVAIKTGERRYIARLRVLLHHLDATQLEDVRLDANHPTDQPLLLVTRLLRKDQADALRQARVAFVDTAGNCFLPLGRDHVAWIEGRKLPRAPRAVPARRGLGAAGYQVELALLADPGLLNRPVREIARAAGAGKTIAADLIERLREDGLVIERDGERRLVNRKRLLDEWLGGYERTMRPRHLVGEFEAADAGDPARLEARLRAVLPELTDGWAFGGALAANHWTGHWRGDLTVLHVVTPAEDLPRALGLLPARRGRIQILRAPVLPAVDLVDHLAHPLLAYAELLREGHERAREAAAELRLRFPEHFA